MDLVEVLVHDVRLIQGEPVYGKHRDLPVGTDAQKLLALVTEVDFMNVEIYPLLMEHYPGASSVGASLGVVQSWLHPKKPPPEIVPRTLDGSTQPSKSDHRSSH